MSYAVEWMGGGVVYGIVLLLLIVPEFAAIAVVVATIAVLVVALAALVGLVALASPYLLVRSVRRRLCPTKNTMDPLAERDPGADRPPDRLRVLGRAHVTASSRRTARAGRDPRGRHSGRRVGERRGRPPRLTPRRAGAGSGRAGSPAPGAADAGAVVHRHIPLVCFGIAFPVMVL